jgi:predicted RNA-binding Zn-ribbon protein involved in translation (DUF1610 family)
MDADRRRSGRELKSQASNFKTAIRPRPPACPDCGKPMHTVSYTIWGITRFNPQTGTYEEDESLGNTDMEFRCPHCSAKIDPEGIIF